MMSTATPIKRRYQELVRKHLGHNGVECRVWIGADGWVRRHGHPEPADRSMDYWHDIGNIRDIIQELRDCGLIPWERVA
jgi:hypothetical protein